jgi:hypothetical protein
LKLEHFGGGSQLKLSNYKFLLLFEDNFEENVRRFKEKFGKDFDVIALKNPEEFLKHVI